MKREPHVRFCEGLGVQLPWATHLWISARSPLLSVEGLRRAMHPAGSGIQVRE
jgi:hypothetical protein